MRRSARPRTGRGPEDFQDFRPVPIDTDRRRVYIIYMTTNETTEATEIRNAIATAVAIFNLIAFMGTW